MNVCAVRTFSKLPLYEHFHELFTKGGWLPHEPKSEHRRVSLMVLFSNDKKEWLPTGKSIVEAVCRHCGSIYNVEGE